MRHIQIVFAAAFCSWAFSAVAAPLAVVETTDFGNYDSQSNDLGTFGEGTNTVAGYVDKGTGDYADAWDALVPNGMQLIDVELVISGFNGFTCRGVADDAAPGVTPTLQVQQDAKANGTYSVPVTIGALPFPSGRYYFTTVALGTNATHCSYEWRVTVPEPGGRAASMAVFFTLSALAALRRNTGGGAGGLEDKPVLGFANALPTGSSSKR